MLKIIIEENGDGTTRSEIETGGSMLNILPDLGYAVLAIYENTKRVDEAAAEAFRFAFLDGFNDPNFWSKSVISPGATSICAVVPNKN